MEIRAAQHQDKEVIAAIWLTSSVDAHKQADEAFWVKRYKQVYHEILPAARLYLAWQDDGVESFLGLSEADELLFLNTACCFRKKGHASALLEQAKSLCKTGLTATVYEENAHGIAFLEKRGFVRSAAAEDEQGRSMICMKWDK